MNKQRKKISMWDEGNNQNEIFLKTELLKWRI